MQVAKLAPMHIVDWEESQEADAALAACRKWLHLRRDTPLSKRDALLKECLRAEAETEQGKMLFHICNSLVLNKGLMYVSTTLKGETEGVLTFVVPVGQCRMALNGVHHDAGHQGQQTLALTQKRFWWPMMAEDYRVIVRGCPIRVYAPLELVHLGYTNRVHDGAEQAPSGEECPRDNRSFHEVRPGSSDEGPVCQDCHEGVLQVLHSSFWGTRETTE